MRRWAVIIITCALLCLVSAGFGWRGGRRSASRSADTLVVYRTQYVDKPVPVEQKVYDFVFVPLDSVEVKEVHDTSVVVLPLSTQTYQGDNYSLQITGYKPRLDWLKITTETRNITPVEAHNHISVNTLLLGGGHISAMPALEYSFTRKNTSVYVMAGYDIIDKSPTIGVGARLNILSW